MKYEDTQQKLCEKGTVMFLQEEVYMLSTCFMFVNHTKMKYIFKTVNYGIRCLIILFIVTFFCISHCTV